MPSRADIKSKAEVVFREVLGNPNLTISDQMTAPEVEGWDSLNHITLVMTADSGPLRTPIPAHCGQRSGDCGQFLMSV